MPAPQAPDSDRFRGALLGLAIGDAVGTTVEFKPPGTFERVTDMIGGGPFDLPAGAWTDDTSMAMCLAESLIACGGFDPVDQLSRYVRWYREGHWSSTGSCFDIGNATRTALEQFERTRAPYPGDSHPAAAGNGPLMKLVPVALAYAEHPVDAVRYAGLSARTTHGAPEATDACRYFAGLLVRALTGEPVSTLLHDGVFEPAPGIWEADPLHPKIAAIAAGSWQAKQPPEIRGTGYVVDSLEAALWALGSTTTFEDGVLAAVNLGDDADTTAAIFGQLGGAIYGLDGIPRHWASRVFMRDEVLGLADQLFTLEPSDDDRSSTSTERISVTFTPSWPPTGDLLDWRPSAQAPTDVVWASTLDPEIAEDDDREIPAYALAHIETDAGRPGGGGISTIWAIPDGDRLRIAITNDDDIPFEPPIAFVDELPTLEQVLTILDQTTIDGEDYPVGHPARIPQAIDGDRESVRSFIAIRSDLYPALSALDRSRLDQWIAGA